MDVKEKIKGFVVSYFLKGDKPKELLDSTSFIEEGIIDSIGVLELLAFLEEQFGFRVEDEEIVPENFDSVERLVNYVESKLDGAKS